MSESSSSPAPKQAIPAFLAVVFTTDPSLQVPPQQILKTDWVEFSEELAQALKKAGSGYAFVYVNGRPAKLSSLQQYYVILMEDGSKFDVPLTELTFNPDNSFFTGNAPAEDTEA
jgi:hypothetical protein